MKRKSMVVLTYFSLTFLIILSSALYPTPPTHPDQELIFNKPISPLMISNGHAPSSEWWNTTYAYRLNYSISEPGLTDRINEPVHVFTTFQNQTCYDNSIRLRYYAGPAWVEVPFQTWNTTYYGGSNFIKSTMISFPVNVSQNDETMYYVYFTDTAVEQVEYEYYPFVYMTYTFSDIFLMAYYDDTDYRFQKWDYENNVWDDPDDLSTSWTSNEITGTLDQWESLAKIVSIPSAQYTTHTFPGIYQIESKKPLSVTVGGIQGNSVNPANCWATARAVMGEATGTIYHVYGWYGTASSGSGGYKGQIWIQSLANNNSISVTYQSGTSVPGFQNQTRDSVSFPTTLDEGEYIQKNNIPGNTFYVINSTKPVTIFEGDHDSPYDREVRRYVPSVNGSMAGTQFFAVRAPQFRFTNLGSSSTTVDIYNATTMAYITSVSVSPSSTNTYSMSEPSWWDNPDTIGLDIYYLQSSSEDILVEAKWSGTADYGTEVPTTEGNLAGTDFKFYCTGTSSRRGKIYIFPWEPASIDIDNLGGSTDDLFGLELAAFEPYNHTVTGNRFFKVTSNATISIIAVDVSFTSAGQPTGDQGYGWYVAPYLSERSDDSLTVTEGIVQNRFVLNIHVEDTGGYAVSSANVTLYNSSAPQTVITDSLGQPYTAVSDADGDVEFKGLVNETYLVKTWIDVSAWLDPQGIGPLLVRNTTEVNITTFVNELNQTLPLSNVSIHVMDLDNAPINNTDEILRIRPYNSTSGEYLDTQQTDVNGNLTFYRLPSEDYEFRFFYTHTYTGITYTWGEIPNYTLSINTYSSYDLYASLSTLNVYVDAYDNRDVQDADVTITNQDYGAQENLQTDSAGYVQFYRVLNGTWNINVTRNDNYGQFVKNDTTNTNLQTTTSETIEFPMSTLNVYVRTSTTQNPIPNAAVNVTLLTGSLITSGKTNDSGRISFLWIVNGTYNVSAKSGLSPIEWKKVYVWKNYTAELIIELSPPTWNKVYSELESYNSTSFSVLFNDNFTLLVGFFNRTGNYPNPTDTDITFVAGDYVMFRIYHAGVFITSLYWNFSSSNYVTKENNRNFSALFYTKTLKLNASGTAYEIRVSAHNGTLDDPDELTFWITVLEPSTQITPTASIIYTWNLADDQLFDYYDLDHGLYIDDAATHTYSITNATTTINGDLSSYGNGTYELSDSILNGLSAGTYTLTISYTHQNYEDNSVDISLQVNLVPTVLNWVTEPSNIDWGVATQTPEFQYNRTDDGSLVPVGTVTIILRWIPQDAVNSEFIVYPASYQYLFAGNIAANGTWRLEVTIMRANFETQVENSTWFTINSAQTTITLISTQEVTVNWNDPAIFTLWYNITSPSNVGIEVAYVYDSEWSSTTTLQDLSGGMYSLTFDTDIPAQNQTFDIWLVKANHTLASVSLTINILIPLSVSPVVGTLDDPITVQWTHPFNIELMIFDASRFATVISGVSVIYDWQEAGLTDIIPENPGITGMYNTSMQEELAFPGFYGIIIQSQKSGCQSQNFTIYLDILGVSCDLVTVEDSITYYYEDVISASFYFNNTVDNLPIVDPFTIGVEIVGVISNLTTLMNHQNGTYSFTIDTAQLGLDAGQAYQIIISGTKLGFYIPQNKTIVLDMEEALTTLSLNLDQSSMEEGQYQTVTLTAYYNRSVSGLGIASASLQALFNGKTYNMTDNGDGSYSFDLPTHNLTIATYQVRVTATKQNYQETIDTINLVVSERTITILFWKIPLSTVITSSGTFVLPILAFVGFVAYKRISMPYDLKVINRALKNIQKGKSIEPKDLKIPSRDSFIKSALKQEYELLMLPEEEVAG